MEENHSFTIKDIVNITGLSEYSVKESHKILKESEIYKTSRAFKTISRCAGMNAELNGFYNNL